jgi:transketolase
VSLANTIRADILKIAHASGHGHVPTCFSVVEMLLAVYATMRYSPRNPAWEHRDLFVLSKGHAALAHYCVLARLGYFPIEEVYRFGLFGSPYGCHADRRKVAGVEVSTGSLGHGIGVAVGMAMALKLNGSDRRVYVLVGDGESNEGTVWEALMVANHLRLNNLTVLFDNNGSQIRCLPVSAPAEKFRSFGCEVHEVHGHELEALMEVLRAPQTTVKAIIASTIKGYGCPTLVKDMFAWHRRSPNDAELNQLLQELSSDEI